MKIQQALRLLVLSLILCSGQLIAQVPDISSFSPVRGAIGTEVTIIGSNFDTTPANNVVYFGTVRAEVIFASTSELIVEVPEGVSYAPISVLVNGLMAYSKAYFAVTFDSNGTIASSPRSFENSLQFLVQDSEWFIKTGDLDSDGKVEIVTGDFDNSAFVVYQNTSIGVGDVSYGAGSSYPLGNGPNELELADFDGDGKLDVAAVLEDEAGTSFFLQVDRNTGDGLGSFSFSTEVNTALDSRAWSLAFGDFNGDGKTDIVVEDGDNNEVSVFENTSSPGSISFAAHTDFSVGSDPYSVLVADINADGLADVLTLNAVDNSVTILENTSTSGSISFALKVDFPVNATSSPEWMTVADYDGDGLLDLAIKNGSTISILRNNSSASVSLATANHITTDLDFGLIECNDFNGDGKPDLLVTRPVAAGILVNTSTVGNISFATALGFTATDSLDPDIATTADVDGDSEPEILIFAMNGSSGNRELHVMRNKSSGTLITSFGFAEETAPAEIDVDAKTISIKVNGLADLSSLTSSFTVSDFASVEVSGTGQISGTTTNDFINPVVYTVDAEDGSASSDWVVTVTQACTNDDVNIIQESCGSFDFDGDILTNSGNYIKRYLNSAGCDSTVTIDLTIKPQVFYKSVYTTDSYEIGGSEITASGQYAFGPFTASTGCDSTYVLNLIIEPDKYDDQMYLQFQPAEMSVPGIRGANFIGDLDGDDDDDIILVGNTSFNGSEKTKIYLNNGDGTFNEKSNHGIPNVNTIQNASKLIDADGDGDLDFFLFGSYHPATNVVGLYINDGAGNFSLKADANLPVTSNGAIDLADVDGDNDLDILIQGKGAGAGRLWLNDGNEVFSQSMVDIFPALMQGSVDFGDVDGDGDFDVFVTGSTSGPTVYHAELYLNDGTGEYAKPFNQNFLGIDYSTVKLIDLDNDGDLDIFASGDAHDGENNFHSILYFNDGNGNFLKDTDSNIPEIFAGQVAFADLDSDGDQDFVLTGDIDEDNNTSIKNRFTGVYLNNGFGHFSERSFCALTDLSIGAVSIGDLDGDGRKDVFINGHTSHAGQASSFLYLNKEIVNYVELEVCGSYELDGVTLTVSGSYQGNYTDQYGCSYPVNLELTIAESGEYDVGIEACGSYEFGSQILTESGLYTETFMSQSGCDSTVNLSIGFLPEPEANIEVHGVVLFAEQQEGATYQWYDCDTDLAIDDEDKRQLTPPRTGNYYVEVGNGMCTTQSECVFFDWVLEAKNQLADKADVYPSLVDNEFTLNLKRPMKNVNVRIVSVEGHVTFSRQYQSLQETTIPLAGKSGMYLVQIQTQGNLVYTQRVFKK